MGTISHNGQKCELAQGKTIFDYADELAVQMPTSCGRNGSCHECVVEIRAGMDALSPRNQPESFLRENYRLACQAVVQNPEDDVQFSPLRRRTKILTSTQQKPAEVHPLVVRRGERVCYDGEV